MAHVVSAQQKKNIRRAAGLWKRFWGAGIKNTLVIHFLLCTIISVFGIIKPRPLIFGSPYVFPY